MMQAAGVFIFIHASTIFMLYVFVTVFGLGYGGAIPVVHALRADLFGRKIFASLAGITMLFTMVSTVSAPILLGRLYDVTHSYTAGFYVLLTLIALSGVIFLLIRQPVKAEAATPQ
jgi:MFS family permease